MEGVGRVLSRWWQSLKGIPKLIIKLWDQLGECPLWGVLLAVILGYCYVLNLFPPHFLDSWIADSWYGEFCKSVFNAVDASVAVGWITLVSLLLSGLFIVYSLFGYRFRLIALIPFFAIALWISIDDFWIYPKWIWQSDFKWWLFAVLVSPVVMGVVVWIKGVYRNSNPDSQSSSNEVQGFSTDETEEVDETSDGYARAITRRLHATDCSSGAYALGLASPWGTGKTKMLSIIKDNLQAEIVMDFNPWMSISEKSLIKDFFDKLADLVSDKVNPDLYSPISKYADAILAVEGLGSWFDTFKNYFSDSKESSLLEKKKRISEELKKAGKKIYIFIDDMDRLDTDEVFEILKLIRNTADFSNIVYVAAYDKTYLEAQLKNKGIVNASQYIEKIFNIEINIPLKISKVLQQALDKELRLMLPDESRLSLLPISEISGRLNSFRDVKRFARQFYVNSMFMDESVGRDEYDLSDLFILELLRYRYRSTYETMTQDMGLIFESSLLDNGVYGIKIKESYINEHKGVYMIK